jgi:hypothetical protein
MVVNTVRNAGRRGNTCMRVINGRVIRHSLELEKDTLVPRQIQVPIAYLTST